MNIVCLKQTFWSDVADFVVFILQEAYIEQSLQHESGSIESLSSWSISQRALAMVGRFPFPSGFHQFRAGGKGPNLWCTERF